ncbi:MAG: J domain-containing protein [Cyanobacteria bacterium J06621_8]
MINPNSNRQKTTTLPPQVKLISTHYEVMQLHPSASNIAIRRAYRQLSKKYHPDITALPISIAKAKFQRLNEAYAVLSSPERRSMYDLKIGYSRLNVVQVPQWTKANSQQYSRSAFLDPTDRPLSSGEIFVLMLLGLTFIGCLSLVLVVAYLKGTSL